MKACVRRTLNIAVALWTGNASGRDILSGVLKYTQEHKGWNVSIIQLPGEPSSHLNAILAFGIDGVITSDITNEAVVRMINETHVPVVAIQVPFHGKSEDPHVDYMTAHDDRIGELGAKYFLSSGKFNGYGFVSDIAIGRRYTFPGPSKRELAFARVLSDSGNDCHSFCDFQSKAKGSGDRLLYRWLQGLPKPAAVMCYYDQFALQVLYACNHLNLSVPSQVSILGVDNEVLLCEAASPQLSSIDPNHQDIGYLASRHLNALLHGRRLKDTMPPYSNDRVIVRESTGNIAPSATLVKRAQSFIAAHAVEGIGVRDVVDYLKASRRLVFLRFREVTGMTIHRAIEDVRLDYAAKQLRNTARAVSHIARSSGYPNLQTFGAAFRRRFQMTPSEYRSPE